MAQIAIIGDTHVPSRAGRIPDWVVDHVRAADHTIHAGDFDSSEAFETVREITDGLTAVDGNMDPAALDLPEVATHDMGEVRFVVVHGTGPLDGYRERVADVVADRAGEAVTVGVSGHSHELMDETIDGFRVLNPGSATGADPAATASMLVATVEGRTIDVTVHQR